MLESVEKEMVLIRDLFAKEKKLQTFFAHPKISARQKKNALSESLRGSVSELVLNTLMLMVDRKRSDHIAGMAEQFLFLAMEEQQVAEAVVYSVKPLTDEEKQAISDVFAKKVGKRSLRLRNDIDRDLIGGLKIRVGNQIFDGSIGGKLERMKRVLVASKA